MITVLGGIQSCWRHS